MLVQAAATAEAGRAGSSRHNGRRGLLKARGSGSGVSSVIVGVVEDWSRSTP